MKILECGFLGTKLIGKEPRESAYVLSLVPYEKTTTYGKGTSRAPAAVIAASHHIELYDEEIGIDASRRGILTVEADSEDLESITTHVSDVIRHCPHALHGFIGGEHSITPAILRGLGRCGLGIVWVDAHADMRAEYLSSPVNHACAGRNSMSFGTLVQIGVRSLAEEEYRFLAGRGDLSCHREWGKEALDAIRGLPDEVYLSIDVDGLSPELVRSVGTPEPGGLSWKDTLEIVEAVTRSKTLVGFDVVELRPTECDITSDYVTARLVYKIISYHALGPRSGAAGS